MSLEKRRRRWILWAAAAVVAMVVIAVAVGAALPQATDYAGHSPLLGKTAPAVSGTTLIGGQPVSLAQYRGRFVVLNFFASWCEPCEDEAPYLEQFAYSESKSAVLVGVVFEDVDSTAAQFLRETGSTYPAIGDPDEKIAMAYGVTGPPDTFVISPTGIVEADISGPVTDRGLESVISRLHARGSPSGEGAT